MYNIDSDSNIFVSKFLASKGCPTSYKGYVYLRDGLHILIESNCNFVKANNEIYLELAAKYKTQQNNVERSLRHLIVKWWESDRCGNEFKSRPTNKELMCKFFHDARIILATNDFEQVNKKHPV